MLCTPLWSQEYIPPVMALLLHVYLLTKGFSLSRPWPLTNVVVEGCNKVFALDVLSGAVRFERSICSLACRSRRYFVDSCAPARARLNVSRHMVSLYCGECSTTSLPTLGQKDDTALSTPAGPIPAATRGPPALLARAARHTQGATTARPCHQARCGLHALLPRARRRPPRPALAADARGR